MSRSWIAALSGQVFAVALGAPPLCLSGLGDAVTLRRVIRFLRKRPDNTGKRAAIGPLVDIAALVAGPPTPTWSRRRRPRAPDPAPSRIGEEAQRDGRDQGGRTIVAGQ